jgi:rSAM/selenodomain-associated transferase 2
MKYSVIIPTLNSEKTIAQCLARVFKARPNVECIVADGGSNDQTLDNVRQFGVKAVSSPKGRGIQMNEGSRQAKAEILLFLHSDTLLSDDAFDVLDDYFAKQHHQIGTFQLKFDVNHWLLNFYGMMTKFDSLWTTFGDQGIAVRKEFFNNMGMFPEWKLFEDVDLLRKAREHVKVGTFDAHVVTSADRFKENGYLAQQVKNAVLIIKYLKGVSPARLSYEYNR